MIRFSFSFDDGCAEDMRLAELLRKYGISDAIFYIPAEWQTYNLGEGRQPLSQRQVRELDKEWQIGSHSMTHRLLTRIPIDEARWEIAESKDRLQQMLGHRVDSFCYPRGYANDELRSIVAEYYDTARNTLVGRFESPDPVWKNATAHAGGKRRVDYEGTTWFKEACRLLDEAIRRGADEDLEYHTFAHSWELTREAGWDDFEELLKRINLYESQS